MIFHGQTNMVRKADKVKESLNENIKAQSLLYEFLDANPKGTGTEAFNFLTKRNIGNHTAIETIRKYGQEDDTTTNNTIIPPTPDVASVFTEDGRLKKIETPNTALEDVSLPPASDIPTEKDTPLNTNIVKEANNTQYMTSENRKKKQVENEDTEMPNAKTAPVQAPVEESQADGTYADGGSGNCDEKSQTWNPNTRQCEPKDSGTLEQKPPATVSSNVESNVPNADIASEKRRVQEYYKKLDRLEAMRNMKVADARISAKEKFLKEKRLDRLIREAKSGVQRRAPVVSRPAMKIGESVRKVSATEAEVAGPVSWMKNVAQEKNVSPSYVWHVNKQRIYDQAGERFVKDFDANENAKYTPLTETQKSVASETVSGPASNDFMRIMSEQVLVLPNGKVVTPIRQFCETKVLAPGTKEAFFYDFGAVTFSAVTEDGSTQVGESAVSIRSSGGSATPRGTKLTIGYTQLEESPIDIVSAANRSYALESVNDESVEVLSRAFNDDVGSGGDATNRKDKGGGVKTNRWVDHAGSQVTADASGLGNLTFAGLVAAKGVIEDEGLDPSNLVTYTTGKAIRDLIFDPDLDSFISFSRPAIITEATVERIAGTNVVRSSAPAAGTQANSSRSTMFVPNIAFGLITGRDLTMEAQRRNELQVVFLTGTQRIAGFVKNVEATCRISHL